MNTKLKKWIAFGLGVAFVFLVLSLLNYRTAIAPFLHPNKNLIQNVDVQGFVLDREQVQEMLCSCPARLPIQKTNREMNGKERFLAAIIRNKGRKGIWGELVFQVSGRPNFRTVQVALGAVEEEDQYVISPVGMAVFGDDDELPVIECEWKYLYVNRK